MPYLHPGNNLVRSLYIPDTLREEFPDQNSFDPATVGAASVGYCTSASAKHSGAPAAILAARGLIEHQEAMFARKKNDKGETVPTCAWFSARRILEVFIFERKMGENKDRVLGRKARIVFEPENGDEDEETIDTGWIDYYGWEALPFEISLSRTIAAIAALNMEEDNGRKVSLRKQLTESGKKKNRHVCDIRAVSPGIEPLAGVLCQNIEVLEALIEEGREAALDVAYDMGLLNSLEDLVYGDPGFSKPEGKESQNDEGASDEDEEDDWDDSPEDEGVSDEEGDDQDDEFDDEPDSDEDDWDDESDEDDDWDDEDEEEDWDD